MSFIKRERSNEIVTRKAYAMKNEAYNILYINSSATLERSILVHFATAK